MSDPSLAPATTSMERNLALLPHFHVVSSFLAWQPVVALFIRESFGIDRLLTLSAIMYFGVVVAEVPSGWMSDRVGRVPTLRLAALLWIAGHAVFLVSSGSFALIAVAQVLIAAGFAAISGTDVSFHYDTLEAIGREDTYERRQSHLKALAYVSVAVSAVGGGAVGLIDLRWAFALSLVFAVWLLVIVARCTEPPRSDEADANQGFGHQLQACVSLLSDPLLRWIAGYWVAMVVLEHVAHTLAQPYITEALGNTPDDLGSTPLVAGFVAACFSAVGALAAAGTPAARARLGFFGVLLAAALLSAAIVTAMAIVVAVPVAVLLVFRSVQGASSPIVLTTAVAPRVPQSQRATYLSLHSLAGRLTYGSLLLAVGWAVGDSLTRSLTALAAVSWVLIVAVVAGWMAVRRPASGQAV